MQILCQARMNFSPIILSVFDWDILHINYLTQHLWEGILMTYLKYCWSGTTKTRRSPARLRSLRMQFWRCLSLDIYHKRCRPCVIFLNKWISHRDANRPDEICDVYNFLQSQHADIVCDEFGVVKLVNNFTSDIYIDCAFSVGCDVICAKSHES